MMTFELTDVTRTYSSGAGLITALGGVSLKVNEGEFISVVGPSGSGKSTLLHLLGALDSPTSGKILLDGTALNDMDDEALSEVRRRKCGFVFQFFNLLPMLSAWENVALPALLDGTRLSAVRERAIELLDQVGMADRAGSRPSELSGGQMQRVAIARALIMRPAVILADEPTGNLDGATSEQIVKLLAGIAHEGERAVVMVTHDQAAAALTDRTVVLRDGLVVADGPAPSAAAPRGDGW
jgi:putative ABC transport system ATP-binding protein